MRVSGIIHQQICQLKWHLLACLGLIMVLPVEEAVVNLKAGDGFFSTNMTFVAIMFGPLLAGLIACANVQGDLDEKRYIFWRSKPANVKLLITIKFFTGLVASLLIIACPVVFAFVSNTFWNEDGIERVFLKYYVPLPILIAIMTYSLCFASNVLVRKTARAWLIGMLIGCFLLVLPFMLPLDFKDFVSDVMLWSWGPYLAIMLATPAAAFVFALYAAKHDWHLRTNLKGLLWVGAGLVFILLMLFSSQVANIKVLHEKEIEPSRGRFRLDNAGDRIVFQGQSYIDIDKNNISLRNISGNPDDRITYMPKMKDYSAQIYPRSGRLYKKAGNDVYFLAIYAYYRREGKTRVYEKVYLKSYGFSGKSWIPICELDISDCLTNRVDFIGVAMRISMRLIGNKLVTCVNDSYIVVDTTNPGELKRIETKLDVLKKRRPFFHNRQKEFAIPLVPLEEIGIEERIKFSIDLKYQYRSFKGAIHESSIVDVYDDKIAFFLVTHEDIARFDVTHWDKEKVYCKFSAARPFTILEVMTTSTHYSDGTFVKNGKLYSYQGDTLMVFDIRSNRRIRKLGHFVRMDYDIEDMAVLEDGNILLCVRRVQDSRKSSPNKRKWYLYLLKNPE
jgi:ABC-type transport system involved in multi-copper enzyme maturation permease subunit